MNILGKLDAVWNYFEKTRGIGHTKAMMYGAMQTDNVIVVAASQDSARDLKFDEMTIITLDSLDNLIGTKCPILFDNFALSSLLWSASNKIKSLKNRVNELESHITRLENAGRV